MKNKLIGPLKYFTVLFQLRANYLDYLKAIFIYRFRKEVRFPAARVSLKKVKFLTRKNSMDIAHLSNLYEYETTKFILHLKPKIFVDVGAHIGRFSLILAKRGSKVFAYEPEKGNYNRLIKNIKLNQLSNKITPIMKACSNKKEKTKLYVSDRNEGQNSLEKKKKK